MSRDRVSAAKAGAKAAAKKVIGGSGGSGGAATISINHAQVMTEVNNLRRVADELNRLNTSAQTALRNRNTFWEGAAADRFTTENERWRRESREIEQEINELATLIQRIADEIRDAERRAQAAITGF